MKLKLLLLCLFLVALISQAEPKKKDKHNHGDEEGHGRHGHHGHQGHHGRHGNNSRHGMKKIKKMKYEDIIKDVFFAAENTGDDEDDDDQGNQDWLFELQDPDGQCNPNPCLNEGVCKEKGKRNYKCDCPSPFKGKRCEKGPRVCRRGRCGNGECVLTSSPPFYECKCKEPFKPPNCRRLSVCEPNPCSNGGKCIKDGNNFDCVCTEGFSGRFCKVGPDDCYLDDGESYRGNVSETDDGDDCLHWNSHFILAHGVNPFKSFEDQDGLGPHNFCRNPDGEPKPWCFFRRGRRLLWDYCDVMPCIKPTTDGPTGVPPSPQPTSANPPSTTKPPEPTAQPSAGPVSPTETAASQFRTCGVPQPKKAITRIFGGLKVSPGAIPWQVSLQQKPKNSNLPYRHVCGGVLIKSCWVLTAGHCIDKSKDMQVLMGSLSLDKPDASTQILPVEKAIVHENYRETTGAVYNDIALLRLRGTEGFCANETQFVKTACLPDAQLPDGMECTISGWGATEQSDYGSSHLLEANVLLINQEKCSEPAIYGSNLDNTMLCAGHLQGGVDSCQGDSGGPLTCKENNSSVIYGLVSWGDQCGKQNRPGVYTRVTQFLDWIKSKIQANP